MLVSVAILALFNTQPAPPVNQAADEPAEQQEADATDTVVAEIPPTAEPDSTPDEASTPIEEQEAIDPARLVLGSVDPEGAHRMMLTLTNVGAAVERIELSSPDYRELEDRSGYLGHLGLEPEDRGARISVVGPGTPAEAAGLEVGDVIVAAQLGASGLAPAGEQVEISSPDDFPALLRTATPNQPITLSVLSAAGGERKVEATLAPRPLSLIRPESENVFLHSPKLADSYDSPPSFLVRLKRVGALDNESVELIEANRALEDEAWASNRVDDQTIELTRRLPALQLEVVKRFSVVETPESAREDATHPSYHFDLDVEVRNLASTAQQVAYELTGPNGLPIEGYWYAHKVGRGWTGYGLRDVVVRFANNRIEQFSCRSVVEGDVDPMGQGQPLAFVGVDGQYFSSIILPKKKSLSDLFIEEVRAERATAELGKRALDTWENASCVLQRKVATLAAGESLTDGYQVFAGPKLPALLSQYQASDDPAHGLESVLYYGWFGPVARLMLGILHLFHAIVGNYGIAIIMLTVLVRSALFPLSRQQAKNMLKMQELKPEMDRIAQKYKDDMQKRSQAQQDLFRKHNYNPAAGCLPIFLQLPIFLGLYRALSVDVELRQASLFGDSIRFCGNLAAPDAFYDWSWLMPQWVNTGQGMLGLGPYFNLLPIATIFLFLMQQKMFMPPATDDQTRLQQKMMQYMMIFMGFLFFKVPSGLCIYFIASSLWGIAERKMLPKVQPVGAQSAGSAAAAPTSEKKPSNNGSSSAAKKAKNKKKSGGKRKR